MVSPALCREGLEEHDDALQKFVALMNGRARKIYVTDEPGNPSLAAFRSTSPETPNRRRDGTEKRHRVLRPGRENETDEIVA